jgi:uncharacterized iron-regulated membrane protein
MRTRVLKRWQWIHKWTSVVCTAFMLILCVTGLPLIFHKEIDRALYGVVDPDPVPAGTPPASLDRIAAIGLERHSGEVIQFLVWDADDPDVVMLSMAAAPDADIENNRAVRVDARTARLLDEPNVKRRVTYVLLKLHGELFAGLPGKLFLGLMGLLFIASLISGVVLYGPWARKSEFGTYRRHRGRVLRQLDLHNLLAIVTVTWALVVGFTGVLNTWADLVIKIWQFGQLAEMTSAYKDAAIPTRMAPIQAAVDRAREAAPHMTPSFVSFPGSLLSSKAHFAVFMRGNTPVTSRLLKPVLIDATTGELTDSRELPWYVSVLLLSQPLHFGDYGGMPLKIIWALLDVVTIVVLCSGIYLWLARRRRDRSALATSGE